jgi:hypothetical protein
MVVEAGGIPSSSQYSKWYCAGCVFIPEVEYQRILGDTKNMDEWRPKMNAIISRLNTPFANGGFIREHDAAMLWEDPHMAHVEVLDSVKVEVEVEYCAAEKQQSSHIKDVLAMAGIGK